MKTFLKWAEEKKLDLPVFVDETPEKVDTENTKRTGYSLNYPPSYVRGQYPAKYFFPIKASAAVDTQNIEKGGPIHH